MDAWLASWVITALAYMQSLVLIAMSSKRAQQQQWPLCQPACCAAFDRSAEAQVMDKHMQILAKQHVETKFIKVGPLLMHLSDLGCLGKAPDVQQETSCSTQHHCRFMQKRAHS